MSRPCRADLRHVAPHDGVASLRHPRHLLARRDGMKAEWREADLQIARDAAHLVIVRLEFGHGVVQGFHRRAGQFELAGGFQRDRRVPLLHADDVAGVGDRLAVVALKALEQAADRAGLAVGRFVGRGGEIGESEAEFLVLGADAEPLRRLAADRDVVGQLLQRGDRRRVRRLRDWTCCSQAWRVAFHGTSGSPPPATTPARRYRRSRPAGCVDQAMPALQRDATAARQVPPARSRLRDRPAARAGRRAGAMRGAVLRSMAANRRRSGGQSDSRAASGRGACSSGTVRRSHCSAASIAMAVSRSAFIRCVLPRSVRTGSSAATPSSVAFCTTRSVASRFSSANASQRSGSGCLGSRPVLDAQAGAVAPDGLDAGAELAVAAVEQQHRVARAAAHDVPQVMRLRGGCGDGAAFGQRRGDVKAD